MALPKYTKDGKKVKGKIAKNENKAFAIATFIATSLHGVNVYGNVELRALHIRAQRFMQGYSKKVGTKQYWVVSNNLGDIWKEIAAKRGENDVPDESIPLLVECLGLLIPPNDFDNFFGYSPYSDPQHLYYADYADVSSGVLELDGKLNDMFGTVPYSLSLVRPKKKDTPQKKVRDKKQPKKSSQPSSAEKSGRTLKKIQKKKEKEKKKKENLSVLAQRIADARARNSSQANNES